MLTRQTVIWVAKETTYGTDPAMTGANALLAYDVEFQSPGEKLERDVLRNTLTPLSHVIGLKESTLTFKTELKGAGLTGTVPTIPEIGVPLSGCSFDTGVYSGTSLVYSLVSDEDSMGSVAFRVFLGDKNMHKVVGARGTVKFTLEAGQYGVAEFSFNGLFTPVISITTPSLAGLGTNQPPIVYNSSFQIAGFSPVTSSMEIDLGVDISRRDSLNAEAGVHSQRIANRVPTMTFDADAVAESSNPFWGGWDGNVVSTFGVNIGSNAGNSIKISGNFQYDQPNYGDADGIRTFDVSASLVSSTVNTSDDELSITIV